MRSVRLLEMIGDLNGEATAKSLADALECKLGSLYFLLRTLEQAGYIHRTHDGRYGLGEQITVLYKQLATQLSPPEPVVSAMHKLNQQTGETTYITGWVCGDLRLQRRLEGRHVLRVGGLEVGYGANTHARASCKAILAYQTEGWLRQHFKNRGLPSVTANTVTDIESLIKRLKRIAQDALALDYDEYAPGVSCVAAPYFDQSGEAAGSLTVSVPTARMSERQNALVQAVQQAAAKASHALGYEGIYPPISPLLSRHPASTPVREGVVSA
jgi:DNA-binding IclR family transcriptional regulator